ncbi:hypothetical protein IWX46DRAFT_291246 [Phyllosticta citricarpa]|uniref:Uncharacterized protein n=1 Tax=Phyllosticta citricarpa TaxID=55181 RepID=A0ABR1MMD6_9PEZI
MIMFVMALGSKPRRQPRQQPRRPHAQSYLIRTSDWAIRKAQRARRNFWGPRKTTQPDWRRNPPIYPCQHGCRPRPRPPHGRGRQAAHAHTEQLRPRIGVGICTKPLRGPVARPSGRPNGPAEKTAVLFCLQSPVRHLVHRGRLVTSSLAGKRLEALAVEGLHHARWAASKRSLLSLCLETKNQRGALGRMAHLGAVGEFFLGRGWWLS